MRKLKPDYIVGLVDGEGSFTVYVRNLDEDKRVKRRTLVEPRFYIKLVEKDRSIFYALRDFFHCGSVYFQRDRRYNRKDCYRYEVYRRDDLEKIVIPFFKKHLPLLASKRRDFELFCRIMERIRKGEHLTKGGLRRIYKIKQKMH